MMWLLTIGLVHAACEPTCADGLSVSWWAVDAGPGVWQIRLLADGRPELDCLLDFDAGALVSSQCGVGTLPESWRTFVVRDHPARVHAQVFHDGQLVGDREVEPTWTDLGTFCEGCRTAELSVFPSRPVTSVGPVCTLIGFTSGMRVRFAGLPADHDAPGWRVRLEDSEGNARADCERLPADQGSPERVQCGVLPQFQAPGGVFDFFVPEPIPERVRVQVWRGGALVQEEEVDVPEARVSEPNGPRCGVLRHVNLTVPAVPG